MTVTLVMSAYAWRDWYKALCFLVVLVAVAGYSGVPRGMFNIPGISPYNFLLGNIIANKRIFLFFALLMVTRQFKYYRMVPANYGVRNRLAGLGIS